MCSYSDKIKKKSNMVKSMNNVSNMRLCQKLSQLSQKFKSHYIYVFTLYLDRYMELPRKMLENSETISMRRDCDGGRLDVCHALESFLTSFVYNHESLLRESMSICLRLQKRLLLKFGHSDVVCCLFLVTNNRICRLSNSKDVY